MAAIHGVPRAGVLRRAWAFGALIPEGVEERLDSIVRAHGHDLPSPVHERRQVADAAAEELCNRALGLPGRHERLQPPRRPRRGNRAGRDGLRFQAEERFGDDSLDGLQMNAGGGATTPETKGGERGMGHSGGDGNPLEREPRVQQALKDCACWCCVHPARADLILAPVRTEP